MRSEEYYFGSDYFLPVGGHIYKKSMEKEGKDVGIVTRHPRNGLLLVKALESQFQDGHMVLIPVEAAGEQLYSDAGTLGEVQEPQTKVTLQIHVARFLHDQPVMWSDKKEESMEPVPFDRPVVQEPKGKGKKKARARARRKSCRRSPLRLVSCISEAPSFASLSWLIFFKC